jgi:CPA2 family monovalent cation:H+ antiporter-2
LSLWQSSRYEEVFTATALLIALAGGWLTGQVGLSLTLGAFLGGLTLSETPYRAVIQSEITPFRGLMLGFFFMYVGFSLDAEVLRQSWLAIALIGAGLMIVKGLSNAGASILFKWSVPGSAQLGFLLAQGSEFAFVILNMPGVNQLIGAQQASIIIAAIALTMAATPQVADLGRKLAGRLRQRSRQDHNAELTPGAITAPVIIIGMGKLGRAVADALIEFCIEYSAIEKDMPRLREAIADGYNVFLGNSSDLRLWESVDLKHRKVSVLTSPRLDELAFNHPVAKASYPNLKRIAAASDETMASELRTIGITAVLEESPPIGMHLAFAVLLELGVDAAEVETWKRRQILPTPAPSTLVDMPLATN